MINEYNMACISPIKYIIINNYMYIYDVIITELAEGTALYIEVIR